MSRSVPPLASVVVLLLIFVRSPLSFASDESVKRPPTSVQEPQVFALQTELEKAKHETEALRNQGVFLLMIVVALFAVVIVVLRRTDVSDYKRMSGKQGNLSNGLEDLKRKVNGAIEDLNRKTLKHSNRLDTLERRSDPVPGARSSEQTPAVVVANTLGAGQPRDSVDATSRFSDRVTDVWTASIPPRHTVGATDTLVQEYNRAIEDQGTYDAMRAHSHECFGVANITERANNRLMASVFRTNASEHYWAFRIPGDVYLVFPGLRLRIDDAARGSGALDETFGCAQYERNKMYVTSRVLRGAVFIRTADDTWKLREQGKIELEEDV